MNAVTPIIAARRVRTAPARTVDPNALWTGRPAWLSSAVRIWKAPWAAAYFAILLADGARIALSPHAPRNAWQGEGVLAALAVIVTGGLLVLAALTRRTTRYTLGPRAVTLNYGLALTATLVIPFAAIEHVGVRTHADGRATWRCGSSPGRG